MTKVRCELCTGPYRLGWGEIVFTPTVSLNPTSCSNLAHAVGWSNATPMSGFNTAVKGLEWEKKAVSKHLSNQQKETRTRTMT